MKAPQDAIIEDPVEVSAEEMAADDIDAILQVICFHW